jgi:hypothetical protein
MPKAPFEPPALPMLHGLQAIRRYLERMRKFG